MREYDLSENVSNVYYHFTNSNNLENIFSNGLIPNNGSNALYYEGEPKIFFSINDIGFLELCDVWINWMLYKSNYVKYLKNDFTASREDFVKLFKSGSLYTKENLEEIYEKMYEYMQGNSILKLDLVEGQDYSMDDPDVFKLNEGDKELVSCMYPLECDANSTRMERWNMHTLANKTIEPSRISLVRTDDKTDGISILTSIYDRVRELNPEIEFKFLHEFMEYAKTMRESQSQAMAR